jgi:hypothetical protein
MRLSTFSALRRDLEQYVLYTYIHMYTVRRETERGKEKPIE